MNKLSFDPRDIQFELFSETKHIRDGRARSYKLGLKITIKATLKTKSFGELVAKKTTHHEGDFPDNFIEKELLREGFKIKEALIQELDEKYRKRVAEENSALRLQRIFEGIFGGVIDED